MMEEKRERRMLFGGRGGGDLKYASLEVDESELDEPRMMSMMAMPLATVSLV